MMTTLCFFASFWNRSVLGPGIFSASLKYSWFSSWQKYCERNSSWVLMILAPAFAARSIRAAVFLRFASGFGDTSVCMSPSLISDEAELFIVSALRLVQPCRFFKYYGFKLLIFRQRLGRFLAEQFTGETLEG